MAKVMFDLHLGFAIIFKHDDDQFVSQELIQGCSWALDQMQKEIRSVVQDETIMKDLLTNGFLRSIFKAFTESEETSTKAKLMNEVLLKLNQIFVEARKITDNLARQTVFASDDTLKNKIKGYLALIDGKEFSSYIANWKLVELMNSDQAAEVRNFGHSYLTQNKMFHSFF